MTVFDSDDLLSCSCGSKTFSIEQYGTGRHLFIYLSCGEKKHDRTVIAASWKEVVRYWNNTTLDRLIWMKSTR